MSKGSARRPTDHAKFSESWDRIFKKKEKCPECESEDIGEFEAIAHNQEVSYKQCQHCGHRWNIG